MSTPTIETPLAMAQVAELLNVPINTLRYWRHVGAGPRSFKVGKHVRYDRADVVAWLDEQRIATRTGGAA